MCEITVITVFTVKTFEKTQLPNIIEMATIAVPFVVFGYADLQRLSVNSISLHVKFSESQSEILHPLIF